jgi:hypothetical protein
MGEREAETLWPYIRLLNVSCSALHIHGDTGMRQEFLVLIIL